MNKPTLDVVNGGLYAALEGGLHGEALREFFSPDACFVECPNAVTPRGATRNPTEATGASSSGAQLLAWQRYELRDAFEQGDTVIARVTWTAEVARDRGPFKAGQRLTAHSAQFITVREHHIQRLEMYDCYEPFGAS